ncbi:MAG TPA: NADH-quinone oxidoreductase subunit N [Wenzhouxiangellaceae bacterium]|nr:NADH-quinone oxidoreductase subunit N [Wenzhouxiangellaceae bacterium]
MSAVELQALLPLIVLAATGTGALVAAAFAERAAVPFSIAALGTLAALVAAVAEWHAPAVDVDGLLRVDAFARLYWALLSASTFVVLIFMHARSGVGPEQRTGETHGLFVLALLGACVLVASGHFASLFMGLELLSVSLFILIAWHCLMPRSIEAGVKYLVLAGLASGFALFGMALVYAEIGALDFAALADVEGAGAWWWAGIALLLAGLAFKLSLVPFHFWTPDVYQGAPLPVTAFLATVSKIAALALLLRLSATVGLEPGTPWWTALAVVAGASMLAGNWLALRQQNLQRLLAYSSIAHMGYALTAVLAGGAFGAEAVVFYTLFYAATTLGAFIAIAIATAAGTESNAEGATIDNIRGLAHRNPLVGAALVLMLLSLAGIPLTGGFVGKFYVLAAGARAELWGLTALVIVGSGIGLFYYLRVVTTMFAAGDAERFVASSRLIVALLVLLALVVVWLGILPHSAMQAARVVP